MSAIDIAALMAPLGPFERPPSIVVAVSGGSDSLGLGLLLAEWVRERDGRLIVLTVDHGLRAEAAAECARVEEIFAAFPNCSTHILRWDGEKPARGIQAAARRARYRLLADWCRARGILHLAVAHTAEDQAETIAMRNDHGSGVAGLAGMAAVRPERGVRLLRPLLAVSRSAIRAWLVARGQAWLEDPSNDLTKFERVRIRQGLDAAQSERLLDLAAELGVQRDTCEHDAARLLAERGLVHDGGYLSVELPVRGEVEVEMLASVLRQAMLAVSGKDYPPQVDDLALSLLMPEEPRSGLPEAQPVLTYELDPRGQQLRRGGAASLGGCVLQSVRGRLHVFREAAAIRGRLAVAGGWSGGWDNRFYLKVSNALPQSQGLAVGALGEAGLRQVVDRFGIRLKRHPIPLPARLALPALWQGEHLVCQPHLKAGEGLAARLQPRHTVTTCGFTVAAGRPHTIYSSVPG